jgi:hypothetical protein
MRNKRRRWKKERIKFGRRKRELLFGWPKKMSPRYDKKKLS